MNKDNIILERTEGKYLIKVYTEIDECPDLSYLGAYSKTPATVHIDRQERGDMERGEYRYFNVGCGEPDYIEQDYARAEAYNRGDWYTLTVCCEIAIKTNAQWAIPTVVGRAYLSGVESDSGDEYLQEVAKGLIAEAKADLKTLREELCGTR